MRARFPARPWNAAADLSESLFFRQIVSGRSIRPEKGNRDAGFLGVSEHYSRLITAVALVLV